MGQGRIFGGSHRAVGGETLPSSTSLGLVGVVPERGIVDEVSWAAYAAMENRFQPIALARFAAVDLGPPPATSYPQTPAPTPTQEYAAHAPEGHP